MKRETKNNNLAVYKKKIILENTALVKKAIAHIADLSGEITYSSVSKVTYEIADIQTKQKGLTLAAITKNPIYRALVDEAKANQELSSENKRSSKLKNYSRGDLGLMVHALRVENENLKRAKKILKLKLKEIPNGIETVEPIKDSIIKKGNALQDISRSIVNRLCELDLGYIDADENLRLHGYSYIIVNKDALKLFYEKELNDIKSQI